MSIFLQARSVDLAFFVHPLGDQCAEKLIKNNADENTANCDINYRETKYCNLRLYAQTLNCRMQYNIGVHRL